MSSILKALRRVEEEVASEAERDLREEVLAGRVRPHAPLPAPRRSLRLVVASVGVVALLALGFALGRWLAALPPVPILESVARPAAPLQARPAASSAGAETPRPAPTAASTGSPAPVAAAAPADAAITAAAPAPAPTAAAPPAPSAAPAAPSPALPVVAVVAPPLPPPTGAFVDDGEPLGSDDSAAMPDRATEPSIREGFREEDPPPRVRARPAAPTTTKLEAIETPMRRTPPPPKPPRAAPALRSTPPRVASTVWHPDGERRRAMVQVDGASGAAREVREGETVGSYLVLAIGPTGVVFRRDGADVTRRVGQP